MFGVLTNNVTIPFKKLVAVTLLFSSSFAWFFVFYNYFDDVISPGVSSQSLFYDIGIMGFLVFTVISAIIGSHNADKINRRKFLLSWIIIGVISTFSMIFFRGDEFLILFGILAGSCFGIGFPGSMAYLSDSTTPEERGRVAGVAIMTAFVLVILSILIISVLGLEPITIILVSIGIKSIGFLSFFLDPIDRQKNKSKSWGKIFATKDFNYYILAYVFFNISAGLVQLLWNELFQLPAYQAMTTSANLFRYIGLGLFAIIAGMLADRVGRKKPIILGLIMLGAAYALVGMLTTPETYFVNLLLSGLAWGVIMVVYLVVPGDLSTQGSSERYYTLGWVIPLILYIGVDGFGRLINYAPPIDVFSTILSIILFSSIIPILYAKETLSESKLRDRKFKDYTEKVGKIIQESKK